MAYRDADPEKLARMTARAERANRRAMLMIRAGLLRERRVTAGAIGLMILLCGWTGMLVAWSNDLLTHAQGGDPLCEAARFDQEGLDAIQADANLYEITTSMAEDCGRIRDDAVAAEHERVIHMVDECAAERETLRHAMIGRGPVVVGQ